MDTPEEASRLLEHMENAQTIAIDTETSGLKWREHKLAGISVSCAEGHGAYIPIDHFGSECLDARVANAILVNGLAHNPDVVMHNANFDLRFLEHHLGVKIPQELVRDTRLYAYFAGFHLETSSQRSTNLKDLTKAMFGYDQPTLAQTFRKAGLSATKLGYDTTKLPVRFIWNYACDDADFTRQLYFLAFPFVDENLVYRMERDLQPYIRRIEDNGFPANKDFFMAEWFNIQQRADTLEGELLGRLGGGIDRLSQRARVGEALNDRLRRVYDGHGLPSTPTGKPKTDKETLVEYADKDTAIQDYLEWSSLNSRMKMIRTYAENINKDTGRIHGNINQLGAISTGRFSASEPNLQNVGKSVGIGEDVTSLREGFVAKDGWYLVELDYEQIELILMAWLAGDKGVIEAYQRGEDLHRRTAKLMFQKEDISDDERYLAKTINFAIGYGCGAETLAKWAKIPVEDAGNRLDDWRRAHPSIAKFHQECADELDLKGYVMTHAGRKQMKSDYDNSFTTALNKKVQGFAADIQKLGLIETHRRIDTWFQRQNWTWAKPECVAQTHDSQTWMVPDSVPKEVMIPILVEAMMKPCTLWEEVPQIRVEAKTGRNWSELEEYTN